MMPDTIAIITVGVALAGLMVLMFQLTHKRLDSLDQQCIRIEQRLDAFETCFSVLEQRQARLEGLMEGIRDMLSRIPLVN